MKPLASISIAALALAAFTGQAANWPAWRGPTGDGVNTEQGLPQHWSATENVRWKTPLPDRGNSTPVVWGNRVFVTQAIENENRRTLMCFDRANGKLLWQQGIIGLKETTYPENPYCSASPATDGERVVVSYASAGLYCYDFSGKQLWHRDLGVQHHIWGNAASPVLHGDTVFFNFGPGVRTFLIALNKKTGETIWQHDEPGGSAGETVPNEKPAWVGSWSDPIVREVKGREELIMTYPGRVCAFDPKNGKELWTCAGLNPLVYTSPIYHEGIVVGMGGYGGMALAVKADGSGDVTATHRLWHNPKTRQRIGSGVINGDYIYILDDPGTAECIELRTGKVVWDERLKGPGATMQNWSSLVLADGKLYSINKAGDAFVFQASPQFQLLATNSVGERTVGSLAVSDGEIFIRTYKHLWCISEKKPAALN